jgi:hypothetical protein
MGDYRADAVEHLGASFATTSCRAAYSFASASRSSTTSNLMSVPNNWLSAPNFYLCGNRCELL